MDTSLYVSQILNVGKYYLPVRGTEPLMVPHFQSVGAEQTKFTDS